jgi:hypothetical protein
MNFYVFSFHSDSSVRREEVGKERGTWLHKNEEK